MITKIENVLGNNAFREIQYKVLDKELAWFYGDSTAYKGEVTAPFDYSFSHLLYNNGEATSPLCDSMIQVFLTCLDKAGENIDTLYRMRLGLITSTQETFVHSPHIDFDSPHRSALIYFNDSDGDTILYDNFYDFNCGLTSPEHVKTIDLKILERHKPVANTFISFEGNQYHSSSTPTTTKRRVVLNVNYKIMPT
jgi:hypothetical protein